MNVIRNALCKTAIIASSFLYIFAEDNNVAPFLSFRPASRDLAGKVVGTTSHHVHLYGMESYYGFGDIRFKYSQSFRPKNISKSLFGQALINSTSTTTSTNDNDNSNQIIVSGSQASNRGTYDLMAENFYLPRDFKSTLTFKPKVQRFQVDFNFHMNLDEWVEGLYIELYGPFVHSRHDLDFEETVNSVGTVGYGQGYFDTAAIAVSGLNSSFATYAAGNSTVKTTTVKVNNLAYAKFDGEKHSKSEFGELRMEIGYDVLLDEDYHLGFSLEVAAPTGRRAEGEYLFEPIATNGKHWEIGGGLSGHYTAWRSDDEEKHFDFIFETKFLHLLKARTRRTFDVLTSPLSRYLLAEKMTKNSGNLGTTATGNPQPTYQFAAEYAPVANISTLDIKTSVGIQADVVGMFNFTCKGLTWDLGYEFFGGSKEKIHSYSDTDDNRLTFAENAWALKGNASVYGFANLTPTFTALSATDSSATIYNSTIGATSIDNTNANSAINAVNITGTTITTLNAGNTVTQINTSSTPILIALTDLNMEGAETKTQSHKLFTHLGYTWVDREDWVPFIGVGAEVEFGKSHHIENGSTTTATRSTTSTTSSVNCALSQWGVWLKGGVSFN